DPDGLAVAPAPRAPAHHRAGRRGAQHRTDHRLRADRSRGTRGGAHRPCRSCAHRRGVRLHRPAARRGRRTPGRAPAGAPARRGGGPMRAHGPGTADLALTVALLAGEDLANIALTRTDALWYGVPSTSAIRPPGRGVARSRPRVTPLM